MTLLKLEDICRAFEVFIIRNGHARIDSYKLFKHGVGIPWCFLSRVAYAAVKFPFREAPLFFACSNYPTASR